MNDKILFYWSRHAGQESLHCYDVVWFPDCFDTAHRSPCMVQSTEWQYCRPTDVCCIMHIIPTFQHFNTKIWLRRSDRNSRPTNSTLTSVTVHLISLINAQFEYRNYFQSLRTASSHISMHHSIVTSITRETSFSSWNSVDAMQQLCISLPVYLRPASAATHHYLPPISSCHSSLHKLQREEIMIILSTVPCEQYLSQRTETSADTLSKKRVFH